MSCGFDIDNAIAVIGIETGWTPNILDNLFIDDIDYHGLMWWAKHINKENESLKKKKDGS